VGFHRCGRASYEHSLLHVALTRREFLAAANAAALLLFLESCSFGSMSTVELFQSGFSRVVDTTVPRPSRASPSSPLSASKTPGVPVPTEVRVPEKTTRRRTVSRHDGLPPVEARASEFH
jgi:hypothetical protein